MTRQPGNDATMTQPHPHASRTRHDTMTQPWEASLRERTRRPGCKGTVILSPFLPLNSLYDTVTQVKRMKVLPRAYARPHTRPHERHLSSICLSCQSFASSAPSSPQDAGHD